MYLLDVNDAYDTCILLEIKAKCPGGYIGPWVLPIRKRKQFFSIQLMATTR
jgi:hypothetical protein